MAVVNISLPDQMKQYVEERVGQGEYNTTSEYFRDLIRQDQKRRAEESLEAKLLAGLASQTTPWTNEDVGQIKKVVRDRLTAKQQRA